MGACPLSMRSFGNELKLVLRRLKRSPLFTAMAVITLAVGIGANSAIFSIVNGVLLKPLPFRNAERLVGIWHTAPGLGPTQMNQAPAFHVTYQEQSLVFESIGMWGYASASVTGLAEPEEVAAVRLTHGILPTLGVQPVFGRAFSAEDDSPGSQETVILSYGYWQRRFGRDPGVIGRKLVVDGRPREIIGVMPQDFRFVRSHPLLYFPFRLDRSKLFVGNFGYMGIARLKPGITLEQANADVARMIPIVIKSYPMPPGFTLQMFEEARLGPDVHPLKQDEVGDVGKVLWVLLGIVTIVLLIACANVANLFLVHAESRQRELAIRCAMGAGWYQVAREILFESVTLGLIGGALGLFLANAGVRLLVAKGPGSIPRLEEISVDPAVLLFTAGISVFAGLLFGLIPVFRYWKPDLATALKEGGRSFSNGKGRHRARNALAISQIALALVLLISSGLLIRTFQAMREVPPGFVRPEEVLTLRISIPKAEVSDDVQAVRMQEQIVHRIEQVPGVESIGLSTSITMDGNTAGDPVFVEDFPAPEGQIPVLRRHKWVSPNYFATMGNPILAGRDFTWSDMYNKAPVALITETLAREYWEDPAKAVGRRIRETPKNPWREIIGVVGEEFDDGVNRKATPTVYWPMLMANFWEDEVSAQRTMAYAIRSRRAGNTTFYREVQQAVWSTSSNLPLANVRLLSGILADSMERTSFTLVILAIAAGIALILGVVGVYGVVAYSVSQRTREIGIRIALGARQGAVRRMFVGEGLLLTCAGLALGLGAAVGLTRLMSALLFGVSPLDPITFCTVALILAAAALLAAYVPACRASSVEPIEALRWE